MKHYYAYPGPFERWSFVRDLNALGCKFDDNFSATLGIFPFSLPEEDVLFLKVKYAGVRFIEMSPAVVALRKGSAQDAMNLIDNNDVSFSNDDGLYLSAHDYISGGSEGISIEHRWKRKRLGL